MNNFDYPSDQSVESDGLIDFADLRLSDMLSLKSTVGEHRNAPARAIATQYFAYRQVLSNGQPRLFTMVDTQLADEVTRVILVEQYEFCLQNNDDENEYVDCTIDLKYKIVDGRIVEGSSKMSLIRHAGDNQALLPKGVGIQLYRKSLDFIASLAVKMGIPIIDHAEQASILSQNEIAQLSSEQWKRIFLPVLEDYGYEKIDATEGALCFRKRYEPVVIQYHR